MAKRNLSTLFKSLLLQFVGEADPLLSMLEWMTQQLMQVEAEARVGAEKGRHSTERRTHFSGYRWRRFDTRLGTTYLCVPKLRNGGYVPFFVVERKRSEQALLHVIQEAFVNGVSTRKVERLAKALGIEGMSASQVSEITRGLDEQVEAFRSRALDEEYPVVWVDALYEKIRMDGRVISAAALVVTAINRGGTREILAVEPMESETEATYTRVFEGLKARGLKRVWLVVSDAHLGIQAAVKKCFLGSSWQRCRIHFIRNILGTVGQREKARVAAKLKQIWQQPDRRSAIRMARLFIAEFRESHPLTVETLRQGLEDSLQFYAFEELDGRKISSTNMQERLHEEVRRRSRVVGIFPSSDSYVRLVTAYLIEYSEEWAVARSYIRSELIERCRARLRIAA
ncbi:MAG: IS256 family transposase [Spirochaetia bacterium]|jgi:transposase-like protein